MYSWNIRIRWFPVLTRALPISVGVTGVRGYAWVTGVSHSQMAYLRYTHDFDIEIIEAAETEGLWCSSNASTSSRLLSNAFMSHIHICTSTHTIYNIEYTISYHVFEDNLFVVRGIGIVTRLEFIIYRIVCKQTRIKKGRSICLNVYDWKKAHGRLRLGGWDDAPNTAIEHQWWGGRLIRANKWWLQIWNHWVYGRHEWTPNAERGDIHRWQGARMNRNTCTHSNRLKLKIFKP